MAKLLVLLSLLFLANNLNAEIFSAIDGLEKLAQDEKLIIQQLKSLSSQVKDDYLERKLIKWENEYSLVEQDVTKYITNPLNAFLLIKRSTSDIQLITSRVNSTDIIANISDILPKSEDLFGAVEGLIRLQFIYKLRSVDFANGIIDGIKLRSKLSPHDLFVIGQEAFKIYRNDYFVKEYLQMALEDIRNGFDPDKEVDINSLLLTLCESYNRTGDYTNAISIAEDLIRNNVGDQTYVQLREDLKQNHEAYAMKKLTLIDPYSDKIEKNGKFDSNKELILYSQVCRGNVTKSLKELATLKCRYFSNNLFSKLAPFKIEEVNLDPYIVLFIDILSDSEIDYLKLISKPKVRRASIFQKDFAKKISSLRVAKMTWHLDEHHDVTNKISRRLEEMTGLTQTTAEAIQVQNYGIGGHYVPHWDHRIISREPNFPDGNRIATALFYLSDIEKGGATIFPYLKLRIDARKNSAAFWYNLKPSGEGDFLTRHAACPVLLGSKWIANKWIHEHGQEFRRPCPIEKFVQFNESDFYKPFF